MSENNPDHHSRGRGLLTETDREYLLGQIDYGGEQQERNRRRYIRERVRNGIIDFNLLTNLEERDIEQIFSDLRAPTGMRDDSEGMQIYNGMASAIGLYYTVSEDRGITFADVLKDGIREAEKNMSGKRVTDVKITIYAEGGAEMLESTSPLKIDISLNNDQRRVVQEFIECTLDALEDR